MWTGSQAAQGTPNRLNHSEQFLQHTHDLQKVASSRSNTTWRAVGGIPWSKKVSS